TFGTPVGDIVQRRSFVSQQALLDATQPKGRRYYWKAEHVRGASESLGDRMIEHARTFRAPHSALLLFPLGGTLDRLPVDHTAAANRDAGFVLNIASSWERPEQDAEQTEWTRAVWNDLRAFSTGGTYVNFLTQDE